MKQKTIVFISDQKTSSNSVLTALRASGLRVLSTSTTQTPALLFIMRCIVAVILDHSGNDNTTLDIARKARAICHDVPVILLSPEPISPLPSDVDACVSTAMPLTNLVSAVLQVLTTLGDRPRRASLREAS
jgi:DNA-binding MurR/RpiR family transcriptional regulator